MNSKVKEMLMGHSLGLDDNYFKPGENKILQEYLKAVDYLTLNEENRLRRELECEKKKENEITELKKRQEKFELLIQSLIDSGQLKPTTTITHK